MFSKCCEWILAGLIVILLFMQVDGVTLTNSPLPNVGFVQFKYGGSNRKVCWNTLNNKANFVICRQLGYERQRSIVKKAPPSGNKDAIFTGSINCSGGEKNLSKCSITKKAKSCSQLSYLRCVICPRQLSGDKQRFPDSSFTASNSSEGHSPSDARKSSGSSWCAPVADGNQYLQLDLRRLYVIYRFITFGDSSSAKWVKTYKLNYTDDLINWKPVWEKNITGNKQAYNDASITHFKGGTTIRALRFIPLTYVGQPCMRIEICGGTRFPDKPTKLTVTNIKSGSAEISWADPKNTGDYHARAAVLSGFSIKLKIGNCLIVNITTNKVNKWNLTNLAPYTTYEISVAAGNKRGGFGEETTTSFRTSEITSGTAFGKVNGVSLLNSSLPNEGFVQIKYGGTKNVCWQSLKKKADNVICRQLGYTKQDSLVKKAPPSNNKDPIFSGSINCNGGEKNLSQCTITNSTSTCSELSYIKCFVCTRPLLGDKRRFPDSSFTASASSESHSPSDARISSGSSWCAPVADGKHYLEVDLGRLYVIYRFRTFGASSCFKWVTTFKLNYTVDLINWKPVVKKKLPGNRNAYDTSNTHVHEGVTIRALRFIPLTYVGQPCMRIEICGGTRFPDKPTNLTATNITSSSADISWVDPENTGDNRGVAVLSGFFITLKKNNSLIRNITTDKVNKRKLINLTPNTTYQITVAAGNQNGFGEETITLFTTLGKVLLLDKPSKLTVINITSESAGISWVDPANAGNNDLTGFRIKLTKDNAVILNITINKVNKYEIDNLTLNTTYEISVAAGNQNGFGEETITSFTTLRKVLLPDKPSKLTVINITSESAGISWVDPANGGNIDLTGFRIKLTKDNTVILNITIKKVNKYEIDNLTPNTTYEVSVAAGNQNGFGEDTITSFTTLGKALLPDKPSKLTVTNVTSESAGISWEDPANGGNNELTGFRIKLTKDNTVILNITTNKVNKYEIDNLTPNTAYEISVAAGNQKRFGEETITSFTTLGKALLPDKPSKLTVNSITSESAGISWEDPANGGNNGLTGFRIKLTKNNTVILNTTIDKVNKYEIDNLTPNTTYKISVAAGNQKGFGEETITSFKTFGKALLPDKPSKLTITSISYKSAGISWEDPANGRNNGLTGFWIKLTKNNTLILNITIDKVNKYKIYNLTSSTTYEIFVAAGNQNGFGEWTITSFRTTSIKTLGKSTGDTDDSSAGYIAGVATLAVVVNVVLAILAYIIYRYRQLKSAITDYLGEETSAQITTMLKGKQRLKSVIADNLGEETSTQITALLNNGEERLKSAIADNLGEEPSTDVTVLADKGRKVSKDINDNNPVQKQAPKVLFKKGQHCLIHKDDDHCEKVELLDIGYV